MNRYEVYNNNTLPAYKDVDDLIEAITDYFHFSLSKINFSCQNGTLPCDYWDKRAKEWSYTVSAYMTLVKQVLSKDFDYIDDLAEELSQFYSDLIRGYGEASKKTQEGSNTSAAREYFCCALRMMEDLMDYIYCVVGLPID